MLRQGYAIQFWPVRPESKRAGEGHCFGKAMQEDGVWWSSGFSFLGCDGWECGCHFAAMREFTQGQSFRMKVRHRQKLLMLLSGWVGHLAICSMFLKFK